ncbi:hypothetical protein [Meiothermus sp.]|uniref:hypothetical protein n=1 Tax=Meiothermus sp. TaxID=1955249 RepID=UPI0021DDFF65|nr:hypothetical protein [Meiothermus sp.]GIW35303.1 MAG: hypothetical protein KatS3mg072_2636 [Meiothermus sp.]
MPEAIRTHILRNPTGPVSAKTGLEETSNGRKPDRLLGRREVLALLLVASSAWAQGGRGSDREREKDNEKDRKPEPRRQDERGHTLYAEINLAKDGIVALSAGRLETTSPWAAYLAPRMLVKAQGRWENGIFYARSLEVTHPTFFSYYRGPGELLGLGAGWIEVWYTSASEFGAVKRFALRSVTPGSEPLLLARSSNGRWIALPAGLSPVAPPGQGWYLLRGEAQGSSIRWKSAQPFP